MEAYKISQVLTTVKIHIVAPSVMGGGGRNLVVEIPAFRRHRLDLSSLEDCEIIGTVVLFSLLGRQNSRLLK